METMELTTIAEANKLLKSVDEAFLAKIILDPNKPFNQAAVEKFAQVHNKPELLEMTRQIDALRKQIRLIVDTACTDASEVARKVSQELGERLFGVKLPAAVTMRMGRRTVTHHVTAVRHVVEGSEGVHGYVRVMSNGGFSASDERFFTHDGVLQWAEPDIY